ncbi:hypothetical protein ACJRO7_004845 [Eucalyptus globulus]|uniref:Uncharacterized protein n=1 Tax=Eucalyptus globulus TaxID=34317 RepID=A0ABD3J065_EUCGL
MESFNNSNNNNKRAIALGMPPLPLTSQRMEGQSSHNPNIHPEKFNRTLASRQYGENFRLKHNSRIMKSERTLQALDVDVERASMTMYYWKRQHYLFQVENDELKQNFGSCSLEIESKQAEYVLLNRKKDVYVDQQKYEELMKSNMANAEFMDMDMDTIRDCRPTTLCGPQD